MAEEQKFFETADGYVLQGRDDEVRPLLSFLPGVQSPLFSVSQ